MKYETFDQPAYGVGDLETFGITDNSGSLLMDSSSDNGMESWRADSLLSEDLQAYTQVSRAHEMGGDGGTIPPPPPPPPGGSDDDDTSTDDSSSDTSGSGDTGSGDDVEEETTYLYEQGNNPYGPGIEELGHKDPEAAGAQVGESNLDEMSRGIDYSIAGNSDLNDSTAHDAQRRGHDAVIFDDYSLQEIYELDEEIHSSNNQMVASMDTRISSNMIEKGHSSIETAYSEIEYNRSENQVEVSARIESLYQVPGNTPTVGLDYANASDTTISITVKIITEDPKGKLHEKTVNEVQTGEPNLTTPLEIGKDDRFIQATADIGFINFEGTVKSHSIGLRGDS